jgi:superfamily I DNA/RNA helicase
MFRILLSIIRPGGDLVIALDEFQDLYRREGSWKSLGIEEAKGKTRTLNRVYRNTAEILAFSQRFIGQEIKPDPQQPLFPDAHLRHGPAPELSRFKNQDDLENFILKEISDLIRQGECRRSEIAILYDDKVYSPEGFKYQGKEIPVQLLKKLESAGIPTNWVSQDVRAKELFDITTDRVSLISIHSAKGLDFDLVYLMGVDRIIPTDETRERLIRLLYVAITRAKYRLVIPYVEETEFITRFKS